MKRNNLIKSLTGIFLVFGVFGQIKSQTEPVIEEGFVTFATADYFPLLEVTLESVHEFSTRPIVAYGVNADIPFSTEQFPRLIKKRVNVDLSRLNIFAIKPWILLDVNIKYGVYIEADHIANAHVDDLFDFAHAVKEYPLCPYHPQQPDNQQPIMQLLNVTRKSMPYIHAHPLFSPLCRPFIEEWYQMCLRYINLAQCFDETILNVLLWKHNATKYVPLYGAFYMRHQGFFEGKNQENPYEYCMIHGCKDPAEARRILKSLRDFNKIKKSTIF